MRELTLKTGVIPIQEAAYLSKDQEKGKTFMNKILLKCKNSVNMHIYV